eukprot:3686734-Lingulodinium_polyedra.AAC.1
MEIAVFTDGSAGAGELGEAAWAAVLIGRHGDGSCAILCTAAASLLQEAEVLGTTQLPGTSNVAEILEAFWGTALALRWMARHH